MNLTICVANEITLTDAPKEVYQWAERELMIDNPDYIKKARLGKWVGNTPRKIKLFKNDDGKLIIPVGAMRSLKDVVKRYKIKCVCENNIPEYEKKDFGAKVNLYDYQEEAVNRMESAGYGILCSKAGSGKTQMGIALATRLGVKTLWLTHTHDLLNQSYERAIQCGMTKDKLGKITAGKIDIGSHITFATVQTLSKQDLTQYRETFGCVIVDECHRCAGTPTAATQFSKVISNLNCAHKYGLSATVHRADGLIKTTYMLLGEVAYTVPDEAIADKVMTVEVNRIDIPNWNIPNECLDTDGTIIYSKLISGLDLVPGRNEIIAERLVRNKEHYNLVLSDRLDHLQHIIELLPEELQEQCAFVNGKMTTKKGKEEREKAIEDMRSGKKHFLFASYKLAKEGLDIPRLDRLHLATPQKDYSVIIQSVGRIARIFSGKTTPICYDYVDNISLFESMWRKRRSIYRKGDCRV